MARYADNKGYVFFEGKEYPWAWTYRDYVIRAFNEDKPFDRFVLEQLAADLLTPNDVGAQAALGFLTVGGHFMNNTQDIIDDRIRYRDARFDGSHGNVCPMPRPQVRSNPNGRLLFPLRHLPRSVEPTVPRKTP